MTPEAGQLTFQPGNLSNSDVMFGLGTKDLDPDYVEFRLETTLLYELTDFSAIRVLPVASVDSEPT
jgi:hypothetical protein